MKNIQKTTIVTLMLALLATGFTACSNKGAKEYIEITAACNAENNLTAYQTLKSGDSIIEEDNAIVEIHHDQANNKSICIKSGKAQIVR